MMNVVLSLLFVVTGGFMIYYSKRFKDWFGQWSFAERNLGGTDQGFVLIGFAIIVLGLLSLFGVVNINR